MRCGWYWGGSGCNCWERQEQCTAFFQSVALCFPGLSLTGCAILRCPGTAALFASVAAPASSAERSANALARRYATNSTCSLQPVDLAVHGFDVCQMTSRHLTEWPIEAGSDGTDDSASLALRRVPITFGESDCEVELTGCNPGTCYTIFDLSSRYAPSPRLL